MKNYAVTVLFLTCTSLYFKSLAQTSTTVQRTREYYTALDAGNQSGMDGMLSEPFSAQAPFTPVAFDRKGWLMNAAAFKEAFPDMTHTIDGIIAEDSTIAVHGTFMGTNLGPIMGNPETGNKVTLKFMTWIVFNSSNLIQSIVVQFNMKDFESQLMAGIAGPKK